RGIERVPGLVEMLGDGVVDPVDRRRIGSFFEACAKDLVGRKRPGEERLVKLVERSLRGDEALIELGILSLQIVEAGELLVDELLRARAGVARLFEGVLLLL